jgi:hypothetical protein
MAPLLRLYPFKYRCPVSGTWIKSRYKATLSDIAARYAEWMIAGEPEVRGNLSSSSFNPYRWTDGAVSTISGPDVELLPAGRGRKLELDSLEVFLVVTFLRRYVTYCARRRRFAAMQGAAALLCSLRRYVPTDQA